MDEHQEEMLDSTLDSKNEEESSKNKKKRKSKALEAVETIFIAFLLAIFIRATVAEARYIPSASMEPTLQIGDRLIIEKISYHFTEPHRRDIIVFYPPLHQKVENTTFIDKTMRWFGFTSDVAYIKRVIGLPGETIEVKEGKVFVNNTPLVEDYIKDPPYYTYGPLKVPMDSLFMMGDNRNNSQDSHRWGPMPIANIIGRAVVRFWPVQRIGPAS